MLIPAQLHSLASLAGIPVQDLQVTLRQPLAIQTNHLYDVWAGGEHWIVKQFSLEPEMHLAAEREYRGLSLLAPYDLAPQPVAWLERTGYPLVIYRFMDGQMWDRRHPTTADLGNLLQVLLQLKRLPPTGLWLSNGSGRLLAETGQKIYQALQSYANWTASEYPVALQAAERCLKLARRQKAVLAELADLPHDLSFCKSDPRFANIIERPDGRLGLVDWEDCGLRDPARELADLTLHPNQEDLVSQVEWQTFLREYAEASQNKDPGLMHRVRLYQAIFPIFWLSVLTRQGIRLVQQGALASWQANEMEINQRLQRYLAYGEAWPDGDFAERLGDVQGLSFFPESGSLRKQA